MGLSAALFYLTPRRPYLGVGWLWYLLTLLPVIGLVQVGDQAMADRYTYIPLVGIFIAGVWAAADLFAEYQVRRIFAVSLACAVLFGLIVATRSQLRHWRNTETLFRQALRVHANNYLAHFLLARVEEMAGRTEQSVFHKNKAIEINPAFVATMYNRQGCDLAGQGQLDEAIYMFSEAIRIRPDYATAHNDLGVALARKAQFDEAIEHLTEALRISPGDLKARENLFNVQVDENAKEYP